MQKRKGISLIVLVITIIVMIILAGAIILSLNNAGIIGKANQAVEKTNVNQVQTLAELKWSEAYLNNQRELWQLKKAVREGLEAEGINLNEYDIEITTKGTVVDVKENTDVVGEEKTGADGKFSYVKLANGKIQISKYLGNETSVTIPAKYTGEDNIEYDVYAVGNVNAARPADTRYNIFGETSNNTITSITLEEGIEEIKLTAFYKCTALEGELKLPSTLRKIGMAAFNSCSRLTGDLIIPEGVTIIDQAAFENCSGFNGNLILPSTLEQLGVYAFSKCSRFIGDLNIPDGIIVLGKQTFSSCGFDGTLKLPATLQTLGELAFGNCGNFKGDLMLPDTLTKMDMYVFQYCGFDGTLKLPNNPAFTEIPKSTFLGCANLTGELVLPQWITNLGVAAFSECANLTGVIPKTVILGADALTNSGLTVEQ